MPVIDDRVTYTPIQKKAFELLSNPEKENILLYGGSRSGKSYAIIRYIKRRALKYPGSKHLVCRYSFANAKKTIWLQTMLPEFRKDEANGLCKITLDIGMVEYINGSIIILGGLEPSRISSVLSSEYGTIYICEANENRFEVIEDLFSRLNDTAKDSTGKMIQPKLICDCNPTSKKSWLYKLFLLGQDPITETAKKDYSTYGFLQMNPYDNIQNLNPSYLAKLENMSPAKRKRFFEGEFSSYEGLVFNINEEKHLCDSFQIPWNWKRYIAIDFGYIHRFVALWFAQDPVNDIIYIYKEFTSTMQTVRLNAQEILRICMEEMGTDSMDVMNLYTCISDHDAEDRATLEENGIPTKKANKDVDYGIDLCIDLLESEKKVIQIFRDCNDLIDGLNTFRWKDQTSKGKDRQVVKEDDDEADAMRYGLEFILRNEKDIDIEYGLGIRY